jgi:phthiocerol/phenolphthiocerol synthesis type-I polyketide synthase C
VQFFGVDIDRLLVDRPDLAQQVFARLSALMTTGALRPLVNRVFPVTRAAEAFWHMQQSRHIGKVVLSFDEGAAGVEHPTAEQLQLPQAATYLITGGRSGFGLATAEWLAAKGARHLVLIGRRADTEPDAAKILDRLREQGVEIREVALDVTDGDALAALLQTVRRDMPPLRGVVHCAAIIADAAIGNMSREQFETVLRPKMLGAWNLHRVTQDLSLDFFILYSSAVTLIGNPGQSNYMAANLYLEALAQYRRALKQPALAVMWGAISEVGHLTRHADVAKMMTERLGVIPIAPRRALAGMEQAMLAGASEVAIAELSWQKLTKLPRIAAAPKYSSVRDQFGGVSDDDTADASQQLDLLAAMPEAEAEQIVVQMITTQVAEVMRISAAKLDANKSLNDLGMDSLMVVELNMLFEQKFGLAIPTLELMDMATITKLSRRITGQIRARSGLASDGGPAVLDGVDVDTLPDEALDEVLGDLLERELDRKVVEGIQ